MNGNHDEKLQKARVMARELATLIEKAGTLIQRHTDEVCPVCRDVCCISKHSRYTDEDLLFLSVLGETIDSNRKDIAAADPCQFLGAYGCVIRRSLRPYRCTWYFCAPLLDHIGNGPARHYRQFVDSLQRITRKRVFLMNHLQEIMQQSNGK